MPRISATSISVAPLRHSRTAMRAKSGLYGEGRPAGISAASKPLANSVESGRQRGAEYARDKIRRRAWNADADLPRASEPLLWSGRTNFVRCVVQAGCRERPEKGVIARGVHPC